MAIVATKKVDHKQIFSLLSTLAMLIRLDEYLARQFRCQVTVIPR